MVATTSVPLLKVDPVVIRQKTIDPKTGEAVIIEKHRSGKEEAFKRSDVEAALRKAAEKERLAGEKKG